MAWSPDKDLPAGTKIGFLTVIQKVRTPPKSAGGQRYRIQCVCGKRETVPRYYLCRKEPKTHCGCKAVKADNPYTKRSWYMMHTRCYDKKHVAWEHYGGRGIHVCWRWHRDNPDGWKNFVEDMGERPPPEKDGTTWTLDRFPDNDGIYEPGNCRWATMKQQRHNQRPRKDGR